MPKVSSATFIGGGLVGPKARLKGVVDGQAVKIRLLSLGRHHDGVTEFDIPSFAWNVESKQRASSKQVNPLGAF